MAQHRRLHVLTQMKALGLVPLFYHHEDEVAWQVAQACAEGGCPLVEFTNRGDRAFDVFKYMARRRDEERPEIVLASRLRRVAVTTARTRSVNRPLSQ